VIYIISSKNGNLIMRSLKLNVKKPWAELMPQIPKGHKFRVHDQAYLDISGLSPAELNKALGLLKKDAAFWGIIDPKGIAEDPTAFFFKGAGDYIGPGPLKKGLRKRRFSMAFSLAAGREKPGDSSVKKTNDTAGEIEVTGRRKIHRLPAGRFEGWESIRAGTQEYFFFLFVGIAGKSNLRSLIGDAAFTAVMNRFRELLLQNLREANALLWMESEETSLFLVPPRISNCRATVEAALRIILNSHLIVIEKLNLKVPVEFTFALHYGKTVYQAPGKTGAIISDAVNYIFHLGIKKADPGRLTVSDDVSEGAISEELLDIFKSAGVFEGIPIRHSKRFVYR